MSNTLMLLEHTAQIVPMASDGILDFLDTKIGEAGGVLKGFSIVAGIGFVVWQAIASRGAMARIIMSGLAAGIFVWIVWNVTTLKDRVDNEVNSAPAISQLSHGTEPGDLAWNVTTLARSDVQPHLAAPPA